MAFFDFSGIEITAICAAVPKEEVRVVDLNFDRSQLEKLQKITGVETVRRTTPDQTAADLGFVAANTLIEGTGVARESIGALVFLSHSSDYRRPASACVLQHRLSLDVDCAAYDINLGCSGFPYGIVQVASLFANSDIEHAILITAETMTKLAAAGDRSTAPLFGDAAVATLVSRSKNESSLKALLRTDGSGFRSVVVPAGGFRNRFASRQEKTWPDGNTRSLHDLFMNGPEVLEFTLTQVPDLVRDFLQHTDSTIEDFDAVALHQANLLILRQLARKVDFPVEKIPLSLRQFGNTSSASIPLSLCNDFNRFGNLRPVNVLMCGFGVGLSLGVASATLAPNIFHQIVQTSEVFEPGMLLEPSDFKAVLF